MTPPRASEPALAVVHVLHLILLATLGAGCIPSPRVYSAGPQAGMCRIAVLPLANYTSTREASDKILPVLTTELSRRPGLQLVDPGAVEAAMAKEPWLLFDRIPPDVVERFGKELGADALLLGSVLGYGYRSSASDPIPNVSLSLRLLQVPGGRVLWTVVHSRDGEDGEWLFGFGRVENLEQLVEEAVREIVNTFPALSIVPDSALTRSAAARAHTDAPATPREPPAAPADSLAARSDSLRAEESP